MLWPSFTAKNRPRMWRSLLKGTSPSGLLMFHENELSWIGLGLRLCKDHQAEDLSIYLQRILAIGSGIQLTLLGLRCEVRAHLPCLIFNEPSLSASIKYAELFIDAERGRIELSTDIHWVQHIAEIQDIKELYAEIVHIVVVILQVIVLPPTDCPNNCQIDWAYYCPLTSRKPYVKHCCESKVQLSCTH